MEPLTVSGGMTTPLVPMYEFIPDFKANRGGIEYKPPVWPKPSKNNRFLNVAMGVALTSKCRFKLGAVVVKHGRILGVSPNVYRNNPKNVSGEHLDRCSIHAEVRALRRAGFPQKATVFVVRINRQGEMRNSMPCDGCRSLIEELKCKVVHT